MRHGAAMSIRAHSVHTLAVLNACIDTVLLAEHLGQSTPGQSYCVALCTHRMN
jgi:hypothetical protein